MIRYISLLLFIGLALGQSYVDPLTAARLAKSAAEKAQAEADAATEAAIQAAAEKAAAQARSNAKQAMEDEKARKLAETKAAEEAELDAIAKAAGDEARRKIAEELGLDYEKGIMLKTAVIYLRNGERIDGDIVEIVAADKYIVVRTERENRKRIRYRDINYVVHNNNGLTDYLQAAGKEPEPEPPKPGIVTIIVDPPETNISVGYKQYKANADGIASIELPAGKHEIFFSLSGYKPQTEIITLLANWETTIAVQMYLPKTEEKLDEVKRDMVMAGGRTRALSWIRDEVRKSEDCCLLFCVDFIIFYLYIKYGT